ncbi:uncharacterized protein BDCG_06003 [Blastomyces dermatitidis ER-3]|uniref:Uncharacterized protein n=1 Tax=Ajellomyces dermatitidis (strain ER-3 / ATCC MYA-2586) TaxID=559297 RepID=A0ABP2F274_AJEDR|nr:uncharacterized protein BDCG_06003 [Blastomyces dermatitidis ER-3]EEQ90883.1 hypothetical protein BDCG_06003 [Blastomyces dermatitidis ER-3]
MRGVLRCDLVRSLLRGCIDRCCMAYVVEAGRRGVYFAMLVRLEGLLLLGGHCDIACEIQPQEGVVVKNVELCRKGVDLVDDSFYDAVSSRYTEAGKKITGQRIRGIQHLGLGLVGGMSRKRVLTRVERYLSYSNSRVHTLRRMGNAERRDYAEDQSFERGYRRGRLGVREKEAR